MQKIEVIKQKINTFDSFSIELKDFNKDGWIAKSFNVVKLDDSLPGSCTVAILFEKPDPIDAEKVKQKLNESAEKVKNTDFGGMVKSYTEFLGSLEKSLEKAFEEKED